MLAKYTKKEQLEFTKSIQKSSKNFDGLISLTRRPDLLFIVDIKLHETALKEAKLMKTPVIAVVDTDDNPELVTYPIFANDHGRSSINWLVEKIKLGLKNGE